MALFFTKDNSIVNLPLKLPLILDLGERDKHIYHSHTAADPQPVQETGCYGKSIWGHEEKLEVQKCRDKLSEQWGFFFCFIFFLV